jgi:TetR/AcrR family transcriptional repressor of lmrAB and yxaGH operons
MGLIRNRPGGGEGSPADAKAGSPSRERILAAAAALLEEKGYAGSGIAEIVARAAAPRGSVYYHFPGGKEEIAAAAVKAQAGSLAASVLANLDPRGGAGPGLAAFIRGLAAEVEAAGWKAGGPLTLVAAESAATGTSLEAACREAYALVLEAFARRLGEAGLLPESAADLALAALSAIEGALVLARVRRDRAPLEAVARIFAALPSA